MWHAERYLEVKRRTKHWRVWVRWEPKKNRQQTRKNERTHQPPTTDAEGIGPSKSAHALLHCTSGCTKRFATYPAQSFGIGPSEYECRKEYKKITRSAFFATNTKRMLAWAYQLLCCPR